MSDLISFARAHGILIDHLPPVGLWKRYPTEDHPTSRNGAVKYMGNVAFIQNHAVMTEPILWRSTANDCSNVVDLIRKSEEKSLENQKKAIGKASYILNNSVKQTHPYLAKKGFPTQKGFVWHELLVVPMRIDEHLCGCQLIDPLGQKRFLSGQRTAGAKLTIDNKGMDFLVEGYATALSLRAVLRHLKMRYKIHICFSAGNMKKVAHNFKSGVVIADNDWSKTGERVAQEIGWKYWLSPEAGDLNDFHQKYGLDLLGQNISAFLG